MTVNKNIINNWEWNWAMEILEILSVELFNVSDKVKNKARDLLNSWKIDKFRKVVWKDLFHDFFNWKKEERSKPLTDAYNIKLSSLIYKIIPILVEFNIDTVEIEENNVLNVKKHKFKKWQIFTVKWIWYFSILKRNWESKKPLLYLRICVSDTEKEILIDINNLNKLINYTQWWDLKDFWFKKCSICIDNDIDMENMDCLWIEDRRISSIDLEWDEYEKGNKSDNYKVDREFDLVSWYHLHWNQWFSWWERIKVLSVSKEKISGSDDWKKRKIVEFEVVEITEETQNIGVWFTFNMWWGVLINKFKSSIQPCSK